MENHIIFISLTLVIDVETWFSLKKFFKLSSSYLSVLLLQILNLTLAVVYVFFKMKFYQFLILKIFVSVVICLLIADRYKISNLSVLFLSSIILMFSFFGFSVFLMEFSKAVIIELFNKKISKICNFIVFILIICYVFAVFKIINIILRRKNLKSFLKKVSFFAFGKHINFVGLIDSGNVLYDTKTHRPVILVSVYSLKNYLPENTYKNITKNNFKDMKVSHYIKAKSVCDSRFEIPIIEIDKVVLYDDETQKEIKCVLGIVNHRFEGSKNYDCLLHRDFV